MFGVQKRRERRIFSSGPGSTVYKAIGIRMNVLNDGYNKEW